MLLGIHAQARTAYQAAAFVAPVVTITNADVAPPASTTTPTVAVPGSPQSGQQLFLLVGNCGTDRFPLTTPMAYTFTALTEADSDDPGNLPDSSAVYYRLATGTETGNLTATFHGGNSGDVMTTGVLVTGCGAPTVYAKNAVYQHSVQNPPLVGPTSTVIPANYFVLWIAFVATGGAATEVVSSVTPPSGFSLEGVISTDNYGEFIAVYSKVVSSGETVTYSGTAHYAGTSNGRLSMVHVIGMPITSGGAPPSNAAPVAGFTYSVASLVVTFTDTSTDSDGTIASWSWDFGDSSSSTTQSPTHTYATAGTYTVTLTVTDDDGASNMASNSVTAGTTPVTFDPSRKHTSVSLDGTKLIATMDTGGSHVIGKVAVTQPRNIATDDRYLEFTCTSIAQYLAVGIIKDSDTLYDNYLGAYANEYGLFNLGYNYYTAGTGAATNGSQVTGLTYTVGDVIGLRCKSGGLYLWKKGSGWWKNSGSHFDSNEANATPIYSGVTGNWSPAVSNGTGGLGAVAAVQATGTFQLGTLPSGCSAWQDP